MGGGHWNYSGTRIQYALVEIAEDEQVQKLWPMVAHLFQSLADILSEIEHDMDLDLSGDTLISDEKDFDKKSVGRILEAAMKAAPDEWFPRGKWATIQAVQQRMEKQ